MGRLSESEIAVTAMTDETHDPARQSWVASANGHADFPIQHLPLGVFSVRGGEARIGVAIGDDILDVRGMAEAGLLDDRWLAPLMRPTLNEWLGHGPAEGRALRRLLSDLLSAPAQRPRFLGPVAEPFVKRRPHQRRQPAIVDQPGFGEPAQVDDPVADRRPDPRLAAANRKHPER